MSLVVTFPALAQTQTPSQQQRAPRPQSRQAAPYLSIRGFGDAGYISFIANQSFETILGESKAPLFGGGGQVAFRNGLFFQVAAARFRDSGERVARINNETFRLGIPVTVTIIPVEFTAGYRFFSSRRLVPYIGAGIGSQTYKERSKFAEPSENIHERHTSYHVLGGAEVQVWRWISVAGDVQYRGVPDAIGEDGVSKEFKETDLGGTSVHFKIIVGLLGGR